MTRVEAELKGYCCRTEKCTEPGQWFYTDTEGWTRDYFTKEIIENSRHLDQSSLYSEKDHLRLFNQGDKKIFDDYGNFIGWWCKEDNKIYNAWTVEDMDPFVRYEETNITPEQAIDLGISLIDSNELFEKDPGMVFYILEFEDDEFITKCTILKNIKL